MSLIELDEDQDTIVVIHSLKETYKTQISLFLMDDTLDENLLIALNEVIGYYSTPDEKRKWELEVSKMWKDCISRKQEG